MVIYLTLIGICMAMAISFYLLFGVKQKDIKEMKEQPELNQIVEKFPSNVEIGTSMLKKLGNEHTQVMQTEDNTTLYIAITDRITLGKAESNYTRIQTIAHECLHSIQDRKLQLFHFIYSNIYLLFYVIMLIATICGAIPNSLFILSIFILMGFLFCVIRMYLEMDAMEKAPVLAEEYIRQQEIELDEAAIKKLRDQYKMVTKKGIHYTFFSLAIGFLAKIILYLGILSIMTWL